MTPIPHKSDSMFCAWCSQPYSLNLTLPTLFTIPLVQSNCAEIDLDGFTCHPRNIPSLHLFIPTVPAAWKTLCFLTRSILYLQFTFQSLSTLTSDELYLTLWHCLGGYEWVICRCVLVAS